MPVIFPPHIRQAERVKLMECKKFRDYMGKATSAPAHIQVERVEVRTIMLFRGERIGFVVIKVFGKQLLTSGMAEFEEYAFVQGGSVGILVFVDDKRIAVVEQYRVPKQEMCIEPPAGMIDESGNLVSKALDELMEETDIEITEKDLTLMGTAKPNPAISDEQFYLYYCRVTLPEKTMRRIEEQVHGEKGSQERIKVKFIDYDPQEILRTGNCSFILMASLYENRIRKSLQKGP